MHPGLFVVLVCVGSLAAMMAALTLNKRRRLKARLRRQFGQAPQQVNGLRYGEAFWAVYQRELPLSEAGYPLAEGAPAAGNSPPPAAQTPRYFDLDDLTWLDLDLDDIFARLNACVSATGDIRLYTALRRLSLDGGPPEGPLSAREGLITCFEQNEALCHQACYLLATLGRFDGNNLENAVFQMRDLRLRRPWLYVLLGLLPFATIPFFWVHAIGAGIALLALISSNYYVYTLVRGRMESGFRAVRYLASALRCAGKLAALLGRAAAGGAAADTTAALRRHTARFARLRPGIDLLVLNNTLEENIDFDPFCLILLPLLAYALVARQLGGGPHPPPAAAPAGLSPGTLEGPHDAAGGNGLAAERPGRLPAHSTLQLYTLLGEIDLAQAVLSTRRSLPLWCRPSFAATAALDCENAYHPMVEDPVANSGHFGRDILLTGSNASGKSTFIKALAINCITAQALNTCTATRYALRPGAVATSMAVADSVVEGDSYFVAEIKSMRRLLRIARRLPFSWFFIDEILKGTNTVERIAASAGVLRSLHTAPCLCFAATHDIELTAILAAEYDNYHFRETVTDAGVSFSYRLQPGPSTTRNAILLLERMDYPQPVTADARALVARFEATGTWADPPAPPKEDDNA